MHHYKVSSVRHCQWQSDKVTNSRAMNGFFGAVQSHWANEQYSAVQSTRAWPDFSLVSVRASRFQSSPVQSRNLQTAPQTSPITVNFSQNRSYTDETDRVLSECRSFEWYFDTWSVSFKACKLIRYIIRSKSDIWVLTSLKVFQKVHCGRPFDAQYYSLGQ